MKYLVFIVFVTVITGLLFWSDLFDTTEEVAGSDTTKEPVKIVVQDEVTDTQEKKRDDAPLLSDLVAAGRWDDALSAIDSSKKGTSEEGAQELSVKNLCLLELKRFDDAEGVLDKLIEKAPSSVAAVKAALVTAGKSTASSSRKRVLLSRVASGFGHLDDDDTQALVELLEKINSDLPASIEGLVTVDEYKVVPNDSLWSICRKYKEKNNIEAGLIRLLNALDGDRIYPGQILKIPHEKISIRIWKKNWLMVVFLGDKLLEAHRVGLGKGGCTPEGKFLIRTRLKDPDWYSEQHGKLIPYGDPMNILGTRWLGFENRNNARGVGIHGTIDPDSIGKNMSSGCIRLTNENIEKLFEIIARGTTVEVL